ncbi:MAG TPA: helix-turn-helix domain-containing protein [Nitrososphaerales archaeon]|nr:helix-turn-helix domain-containing protein [Nitrososphaerales archaeon]
MSEQDSVARLRMLGLNLYESRAYLALLEAKQLTAKGVGQSALIPQSRTYDVLESLTRKGFALATPASPPVFVAVPPKKILGAHYESERKRIQDQVTKVHEAAQAKLDAVREAYTTFTKDFSVGPEQRSPELDKVWVLKERESIENTLVGLIKDAESELLRITKPPELRSNRPLDPFYIVGLENQKFVFDALERGVVMKWLSLAREIPTFLGLDVSEPPERRYLERDEDITEKFLLVDGRSVLLNLHDPLFPGYGHVALAMQSKAVSFIFRDHFEKMWSRGKPLRQVLPSMKKSVENLCANLEGMGLGKAEISLYKTLAEAGAITQDVLVREMGKKRVQQQDTLALCSRLLRLGLIHRDEGYRLLMIEHPLNVEALMSAGKLKLDSGTKITTRRTSSGKNS